MRRSALIAAIVLVIANSAAGRVQQASGAPQGTNAFWCPMHPDVRSNTAGRCHICAMELVLIPPPTVGNYRLHVGQVLREGGAGVRALRIEVRHPTTAEPVTSFSSLHERLFHLFIVSRDLAYFAHVHPEQEDQRFHAAVDLDPGVYMLIADFAPVGGTPQLVHQAIVTPGFKRSPFASPDLKPDLADKLVDGLRVRVDAETRLLKPSVLRFSVSDEATSSPIRDLEPFLGAQGHLLIVDADLSTAIHAHPESKDIERSFGPEVLFAPTFATAGIYKIWVQFQRAGKVITAPFAVDVK